MKIKCEHCGSLIDIDKNSTCPNCKAAYTNSKEYKEYKAREKEKAEFSMKMKKDVADGIKKVGKYAWVPFAIYGVIFVIVVVVFILIFNTIRNDIKRSEDFFDDTAKKVEQSELFDELKEEFENFEEKENEKYILTVDSVELKSSLDSYFLTKNNLKKGYTYARVHVYYENLTNNTIIIPYTKIDFIVDGIAQTNKTYLYDHAVVSTVNANTKVEGYLVYEVPSNTKEGIIKYNGKDYNVNVKSSK